MLHYHNMDSSCIIAGPSTHNVCIERLWYDVFRCVGQIFYSLLYTLEEEGLLDPMNDIDLFCVHFAILPKINQCLREFIESWNHHSLSTEGGLTPEQLFTLGLLQQSRAARASSEDDSDDNDFNSIDLGVFSMEDTSIVDVPSTPDSVCSSLSAILDTIS